MENKILQIDTTWTLFLDRDGVINHEKSGSYIFNYDEFQFYPGVREAITKLARRFRRIVVVTNQRGVGKGFMTESDLQSIHSRMTSDLIESGGRIDQVYYSTSLENSHPSRKPNPGMAFAAVRDFPDIDLHKSIMVGNNISDMEFGKNAGMFTVYLKTTNPHQPLLNSLIDYSFDSLLDFAKALESL